MTGNENKPDFFTSLVQPWITQLNAITRELTGQPPRSLRDLPLPGALSAAQLALFDEQLATVEQMAGPLVEWSKAWAQFERAAMNPGADLRSPGSWCPCCRTRSSRG